MIPISSQSPALPSHNNLNYELLSLTAIFGEVPCGCSTRLTASESYRKKVVTSLTHDKLLRLFSSHHLRGYRLGVRAKRLLLQQEPERFAFYLSGCSDTNAIKSEVPRRIRRAPYRTDLCSHRRVPQLQAPDCHNQSDIGTDEEPTRFRAFTHLWARPRTLCTDSLFWQGYAESQCSRNEKHGQRAFSIKILIIKECCL